MLLIILLVCDLTTTRTQGQFNVNCSYSNLSLCEMPPQARRPSATKNHAVQLAASASAHYLEMPLRHAGSAPKNACSSDGKTQNTLHASLNWRNTPIKRQRQDALTKNNGSRSAALLAANGLQGGASRTGVCQLEDATGRHEG